MRIVKRKGNERKIDVNLSDLSVLSVELKACSSVLLLFIGLSIVLLLLLPVIRLASLWA